MYVRTLVLLLLFAGSAAAQDDSLLTVTGASADSLLETVPRDATTFATVGVLFTNKVFLKQSNDGRRDADSAIVYLTRAMAVQATPRVGAYLCIARALRASKDGWFAKLTGGTKDRATKAFEDCDSIARNTPADLSVQFLAANLFQEGDKLDEKKYFWQRAWDIFTKLSGCDDGTQPFFTSEIRGNILLNQGKLVAKLRLYDDASKAHADSLWRQTTQLYPNTSAARNAQIQLDKH